MSIEEKLLTVDLLICAIGVSANLTKEEDEALQKAHYLIREVLEQQKLKRQMSLN